MCVFCGSNLGRTEAFQAAAADLGRYLAECRVGLVYGGAKVGLMGAVADAALQAGGQVIGVIPQALAIKEVAHPGLTELHIVGSMHERKILMAELSDAFIALPGGYGTLDELFEVLTWTQLGLHCKPCGLLNIEGFFDPLIAYLDGAVGWGFLKPAHRGFLLESDHPAELVDQLANLEIPDMGKWLIREQA
jgi:uncharacterized protein (TIGR00730 family)